MDGNDVPPPLPPRPLPPRPGRAVRVHSIGSLQADTRPNDYIDTSSIKLSNDSSMKLLQKTVDKLPLKSKPKIAQQSSELTENITNEARECFQTKKRIHTLPLDTHSLTLSPEEVEVPPLPPRTHLLHNLRSNTYSNGDRFKHHHLPPAPNPPVSSSNTTQGEGSVHHHWMPPAPPRQQSMHRSKSLQPAVMIVLDTRSGLSSLVPSVHKKRQIVQQIPLQLPIAQQPKPANVSIALNEPGSTTNNIICSQCGQCRCSSCTGDRKLPEHWLCEGSCRCSADSVIDIITCMFCVKSLFKKCFSEVDTRNVHPCSCTDEPNCCLRWAALGALSLCLPCLCCYWPLQGCAAAATACYNCYCCRQRGCNCDKTQKI